MVLANVAIAFWPVVAQVRPATQILPLLGSLFLAMEWLRLLAGSSGPSVTLIPPFEGNWSVGQGGRSVLINHHYPIPSQRHALDLVRVDDGFARRGDPGALESYFAFGATLRAPADGVVIRAEDGHADMPIGQADVQSLVGNHVVLKIGPDRYVLLAHLQKGSVRVKDGQVVRAGNVIGRCGNSGNTSQPHLHLQVQSDWDFRARDLRTFPIVFADGATVRDGRPINGPPRRNDNVASPWPIPASTNSQAP
jgi:murein DD-endopeptidase MepM/ murein hydrolase activator NlpD